MRIRSAKWYNACIAWLVIFYGGNLCTADQPKERHAVSSDQGFSVDYLRDVKPILAEKCFACHGALKQKAGLRLDASTLILKGGKDGPVVIPGKVGESTLMERVTDPDEDSVMPPPAEGERLEHEQVEILRKWIAAGAKAPEEKIPLKPTEHWAYLPPIKSAPPKVDGQELHPIDAFLEAKRKENGLSALSSAPPEILVRRLFLDLVGLPPTKEELEKGLEDLANDRWEQVVDDLLGRSQFGERWGRHWMDVWRYSDWRGWGDKIRYSRKHIWRWRDWIIESVNADKGYDRMIVEMLAADEVSPEDPTSLRATGFLARNWYKFDRNVWLDDTVEHTAKAFLGITMNCCRCHDHKYDPISQKEYYGFRAIFEPYDVRTDRIPGELDVEKDGLPRVHDAKPDAKTFFFERGDPKRALSDESLDPTVPSVVKGSPFDVEEVRLPILAYYPALREHVVEDLREKRKNDLLSAEKQYSEARVAFLKAKFGIVRKDEKVGSPDVAEGKKNEELGDNASIAEKSSAAENPKVLKKLARAELQLARKRLLARKVHLEETDGRIAAEMYKHGFADHAVGKEANSTIAYENLSSVAATLQRSFKVASAAEKLSEEEFKLKKISLKPDKDPEKAKKAVEAATKKVESSRKALEQARKNLDGNGTDYDPLGPIHPNSSTGRRLSLAQWIANRKNPLTARVAVNHVWNRHFGKPLVERLDDFGLRSPKPLHADLLDFLAVYLMEHDWSLKSLHRLIVTSDVYALSSRILDAPAETLAKDPDNHYIWRANSRRMQAEVVRDSILAASGSLDSSFGGPDIHQSKGEVNLRRSVYFHHALERQMKFLEMFDAANPRECYRRKPTVRPQQAFALINSSLCIAESRVLAGKMKSLSERDFIDSAFRVILTRSPNDKESKACSEFLKEQENILTNPSKLQVLGSKPNRVPPAPEPAQRARENLILSLFSHNDFVTIR